MGCDCIYGNLTGAMEERRKNKNKVVHCPVCRANWPLSIMPSPSGTFAPDAMPVSVPVAGEAAKGGGVGVVSGGVLSEEKTQLLMSLKEVKGGQGVWEGVRLTCKYSQYLMQYFWAA